MKNWKKLFLTLGIVLISAPILGKAAYAESVFSEFGCDGERGAETIDYDAKTIECYLSEPINTVKIKKSAVTLLNGDGETCPIGEVGYNREENALILIPEELKSNMRYTVSLESGLFGNTGKELTGDFLTTERDLELIKLELKDNDGYSLEITAKNNSAAAEKISVIYAVYENGILVNAGGKLIEVEGGQTLPDNIEVSGVSAGQTVRVIVWTAGKENNRIMESKLFPAN